MNNTIRLMTGFLIGSAAGIAAGLLLAPTSGKQTRKKLGRKSKKLAKQVAGYIGVDYKTQRQAASRNGKAPVTV